MSTDIHTHSHISTQFPASIDQLRNTFRLVRGQGIHGINNKCFYPPFATVLIAIFQNWVEETLGFAGTGTRCNQRGSTIISGQSLKGFLLMHIRKICRMNRFKASRHLRRHTERKAHSNIRLMVNSAFFCQHVLYRTFEGFVGHGECGFDIIPDALL